MKQDVKFISLKKYGFYLAGVLVLASVLKHGIWDAPNDTFLMLCNLILVFPAYIFLITKGILFAKKNIYQEHFKTIKGIKSGMFIGLIAAVIFAVYIFCETKIFPDYYSMQVSQQVEMLALQNLSPEEMAIKSDEIIAMNQPYIHVLSAFFTVIIASGIVSLFATPFIYKKLIVKSEEKQE